MFDSNFKESQKHLEYSFKHCLNSSKKNKKLILQYLICVKLILGKYPTLNLLKKYEMNSFKNLIISFKSGNLNKFEIEMKKYQNLFVKQGTFLILQKSKIMVYRNFFKKV